MYERMLDKQVMPSFVDMTKHCGEKAELFLSLNEWLVTTLKTTSKIVFPYGKKYGWGQGYYYKTKLICNVFPENNALTVMMRLSEQQIEVVYKQVRKDLQMFIDNKYPCGDGGWIHYRLTTQEQLDDIKKTLSIKIKI